MTGKIFFIPALAFMLVLSGCNAVNNVVNTVKKDIPIEDIDLLKEEYIGKKAWTRSLIVDLGQNGVLERGTEVTIIELGLHWNGSVGVKAPNKRKYRHAMNIPRPLTKEKYEEAMHRLFWFDNPDKRYRMYLRLYGKRTARAIRDRELFKGMKQDAALESWGYPDEMKTNDIGGSAVEQWTYVDPRKKTKKRYIYIVDGVVDDWQE